jgi:hypothetical protein
MIISHHFNKSLGDTGINDLKAVLGRLEAKAKQNKVLFVEQSNNKVKEKINTLKEQIDNYVRIERQDPEH